MTLRHYPLIKVSRLTRHWTEGMLLGMLLLGLAPAGWVGAAPAIQLPNVCAYGDPNCTASGTVTGVPYADYCVACYIQVDEVWWTKPTLANPCVPINPDGTFSCDITTGGCDLYATAVMARLMPKNVAPPSCAPCRAPPPMAGAVASVTRYRPYPRWLAFSGYKWRVKKAPDCKLGPGKNYFSDAPGDVWVNQQGLHLRIRKGTDRWYSTEVVLQHALGYGTYLFHTNSRLDLLDPNVVLGLFTWDSLLYHPTHREMDIEFARWGMAGEETNAQFVLQPCSQCPGCGANCSRFRVDFPNANKYLTLYLIWTPGSVEFRAYRGQYWDNPPASALIHQWLRTGAEAPVPGKAAVRFNFWLLNGWAPSNGQDADVIIENFVFRPLCAP